MPGDSAYTAPPFDHARADIILRSSDNIDFRVFKLFLSLVSPLFEALFEVPQHTGVDDEQEVKDGLVVICVQEDNVTLDKLLRLCYPCTLAEDPKLEALNDLVDILDAARRYSLNTIERKVYQALSNPEILKLEPFQCFAIARRGCAREETLLAAKHTLAQPLVPLWFQEIDFITAADLLALLTYHQKCGDAVYTLRNDVSWIQSHYGSSQGCPWLFQRSGSPSGACVKKGKRFPDPSSCRCAISTSSTYRLFELQPLEWWGNFMEQTFVALRDNPCRETVESFTAKTVQSVKTRGRPTYSVHISEHMRDFSALLTKKVEEVVSEIGLVLTP